MSKITGVNVTLRAKDIIITDGQNARKTSGLDSESLFDLGQSMEDLGQINPVHVNCVGGKKFHLIAGERRLRAAIASGEEFIQCTKHDDLDAMMIWQIQITENDPRYRVNLNPIEEANGYQRGIDLGMTVKQIAQKIGASEDTIVRRLRLLKLNGDVQRMITREINPLPIHQAILLADLAESNQIKLARDAAPLTGPVASEATVRQWVDELKGKKLDFEDDDADEKDTRKDTGQPRSGKTSAKVEHQRPQPAGKKPEEAVKPMDAKIGIAGKVGLTEANVVIRKATLSIKIGEAVKMVTIGEMTLDLQDEAFKEISKILKKAAAKAAAPAAEKAKPEDKKTGKKDGKKSTAGGGCTTENKPEAED